MGTPKDPNYWKKYQKLNREKILTQHREYYRKNKERLLKQNKDYRSKKGDQIREGQRKYYQENKGKWKEQHLRKKYNLSVEDFNAIFVAQNGQCAICATTFNDAFVGTRQREGKAHVDHCHTTGKIRGLLCTKCNTALGLFDEDIVRLLNAIDYLKKHHG